MLVRANYDYRICQVMEGGRWYLCDRIGALYSRDTVQEIIKLLPKEHQCEARETCE